MFNLNLEELCYLCFGAPNGCLCALACIGADSSFVISSQYANTFNSYKKRGYSKKIADFLNRWDQIETLQLRVESAHGQSFKTNTKIHDKKPSTLHLIHVNIH